MFTVTPGIAAPDSSMTRPRMLPFTWLCPAASVAASISGTITMNPANGLTQRRNVMPLGIAPSKIRITETAMDELDDCVNSSSKGNAFLEIR